MLNEHGSFIYCEFAFVLTPALKKHRGKIENLRPVSLTCSPSRSERYVRWSGSLHAYGSVPVGEGSGGMSRCYSKDEQHKSFLTGVLQ